MIVTLIAILLSFLISVGLIRVLMQISRKIGLVDRPDNNRKLHENAIPMVGGLALIVVTPLAVMIMMYVRITFADVLDGWVASLGNYIPLRHMRGEMTISSKDVYELVGLLIGSTVLLFVGLADDRFGIRGRQKLLGQFVAVTVLVFFGYQFEYIGFAGIKIEFGVFTILVIYAWVLAAINSVNLLDGADGIAGTIGVIMAMSICVMSLLTGTIADAIVAAAIAGTLLGFLKYNFPPAKAYLGDSGSMLIGFLLSALAIRCMFKQNAAYAFFAPVALLAIPFIDTTAAIIRRRLTGRSIYAVDRGHLHHALMKRGYSPRISLLWVGALCSTTAAGGVLSLLHRHSIYALVSIGIVLVVMIGCKLFGVAEYQLVSRKATSMARSFLRKATQSQTELLQSSVHVQGNRDWQSVWQRLCNFSDDYAVNQLTMDLNAPWLHESFHATLRKSDAKRGENQEWFSLIPLAVDGRVFGRIEVHGSHDSKFDHQDVLRNLLEVTAAIEDELAEPVDASLEKKTA